jgi:hypothetical protein
MYLNVYKMYCRNLINKLKASMLAIATIAMLLISCGEDDDVNSKVEMPPLKVNPATLTLIIGEKGTVGANMAPVTWSSSAATIASVDASSGEITALAAGTATVTASGPNGKTATCDVTVIPVLVTEITVTPATATIYVDSTLQLVATPKPENPTEFNPVWSSSNNSVLEVSQTGLIKGISEGTATVYATVGSVSDSVEVTVDKINDFKTATGYWQFDDASNPGKATKGIDLVYTRANVEIIPGHSDIDKAIQMLSRNDGLQWNHSITGNGLRNFTILIDTWIEFVDRRYYPVYWNTVSSGASMYLRPREGKFTLNRRGATVGDFVDNPVAGQEPWTRIVIQFGDENGSSFYRAYSNGVKIYEDQGGGTDFYFVEGKPVWFLYGQDSGDSNPYKVSAIAVWNCILTAEEIALLGDVNVK